MLRSLPSIVNLTLSARQTCHFPQTEIASVTFFIHLINFLIIFSLSRLIINRMSIQTLFLDIDDCASNPCQNNGVCLDGVNSYECLCPTGFSGPRCEEETHVCSSSENLCLNGGECIRGDSGHPADFSCSCAEGWKGHICQFTKGTWKARLSC